MSTQLRVSKPEVLAQMPAAGHVLIEASAGTGKTYTIEHLVVDMVITGQVTIDQLLVVTFTRKAAAEMAARIRDRVRKVLEETASCPASTPHWLVCQKERARLREALKSFDRATISTIHSFCQKVLSEQRVLTGQVGAVRQEDGAAVFHDVLLDFVRRTLATDEDDRHLLESIFETGTEMDSLEKLLAKVSEQSTDVRLTWDAARQKEARKAQAKLRTVLGKRLPPGHSADEEQVKAWLEECGVDGRSRKGLAQSLLRLAERASNHWDTPVAALQVRLLPSLTDLNERGPSTNPDEYTGWVRDVLHAVKDAYRVVPNPEPLIAHCLAPKLQPAFREACAARGVVSFDRLLTETQTALANPLSGPRLVEILRDRYRVALVDEFQDTDGTQWEIFERIFGQSGPPHRFIAVGDPKQAIYRFRGGDIETYFRAQKQLEHGKVTLMVNYRSTPAMVDAYNTLLTEKVNGERLLGAGQVVYAPKVTAGWKGRGLLRPGRRQGEAPIRALELQLGPKPNVDLAQEILRSAIVEEVHGLLRPGTRYEVGEKPRDLRASDIMCLTYSNDEAQALVDALLAVGVPAVQYRATGLWVGSEAADLVDVLQALAHPGDRGLRQKAFRTGFFGFALEVLGDAAALPSSDPRMAAWHRWVRLAETRKWAALFAELRRSSNLGRRLHLHAPGRRSLLVLDALLDQVHRLARDECRDIEVLANRVGARWTEKSAKYDRSEDDDDDLIPTAERELEVAEEEVGTGAVRVLTVFKAKGLEAPVVFLAAGVGREISKDRFHIFHEGEERLRWAGKLSVPGAPEDVVKLEKDLERRRVQYVALTRAKVQLVLPLVVQESVSAVHPKHRATNERLLALADREEFASHIVVRRGLSAPVPPPEPLIEACALPAAPGEKFVAELKACGVEAEQVRMERRGLQLESFSKMKPVFDGAPDKPKPKVVEAGQLPQGTGPGKLMHALIEEIPLESVRAGQSLEAWRKQERITSLLTDWWQGSPWTEAQRAEAERLVHLALHVPVTFPTGITINGLGTLGQRFQREVPFHFPFPGANSVFGKPVKGRWDVEHGYMKGSIDFAFEYEGKAYLGDWKTNSLDDYGQERLRESVMSTYDGQVRIYTLALMRLLGVVTEQDYNARIGGAVYVYLRGLDGSGNGLFSYRPSWEDMRALDVKLRERANLPLENEDGGHPVEIAEEAEPSGGEDEEPEEIP